MIIFQIIHVIGFVAGLVVVADFLVKAPAFFFKLFTGKYSLIKAPPAERSSLASLAESPLDAVEAHFAETTAIAEPLEATSPEKDSRDFHRPITLIIAADGSRKFHIPERFFDFDRAA
jgi:hypothetical protein